MPNEVVGVEGEGGAGHSVPGLQLLEHMQNGKVKHRPQIRTLYGSLAPKVRLLVSMGIVEPEAEVRDLNVPVIVMMLQLV